MAGQSMRKTYIWIWVVLAVLTVLEIWAADGTTGGTKVSALVLLAVAKAACVAIWYMHLSFERAWLRFIAILPVSAAIYAVILMAESIAR